MLNCSTTPKPLHSTESFPLSNEQSTDEASPFEAFMFAIREGDYPVITMFLQRHPNFIHEKSKDGMTPLHMAAQCNDPKLGSAFLTLGADAAARYGDSGHTPLSWAVTCNAPEFAHALIKLNIPADLFCAAGLGLLDRVKEFFDDQGELVPGASQTGSTRMDATRKRLPCPPTEPPEVISDALYIAARNGKVDVARYLVERGADVNFRAYFGGTPYHWAQLAGSPELVQLLEQAGADPAVRDDKGRTAAEWD